MTLLPSQRALFDIPREIAYFNCAYNAPQLQRSREKLHAGVDEKSHPWTRTPASFFQDAETIRNLASGLFGGDAEGYAVVPAASYGLSSAARAIEPRLQAGDQILLMAEEFPSNVLPWRRAAQERNAAVVTVPTPFDGNWTQAILDCMGSSTKVVAVSPCHWTNGARVDLAAIGAACRSAGITLAIDATQALGAMPFSVDDVQPDFLVAAGYKWLLCPYGFGLMYVAPQWRDARPLEEGWLSRSNAEDFAGLVNYSDTYQGGARRFDVGEKCTATILPGAIAALEQLGAWGVENIANTLAAINANIGQRLLELGFTLPPPAQRCPHLLGAVLPAGYSGKLVAQLKERDIYISQRGSALRFAPHLHVVEHDVERLLSGIDAIIRSELKRVNTGIFIVSQIWKEVK